MKSVITILLLVIIITFLVKQQQIHTVKPHQTTIAPTAVLGVVVTRADSHCKAIHVDQNDQQAYLPDPNCTPGVINPDVTQDTLYQTICQRGYTKTIRPPVNYTQPLKLAQMQQYGYADTNPRDYEEDHFISLELGGSPTDPKNLWPEPHASINEKDIVEDYLRKQVCDGTMTLAQAQSAITHNWYTVFQQIK